jgi:chromosome partitioning protein
MAAMHETCSVCSKPFDVQFRYQMEERDGGFAFYCSTSCQQRAVRGEAEGGVTCGGCAKRFVVELVSQVVKTSSGRAYACTDACREQILSEERGGTLGNLVPIPAAQLRSSVDPAATLGPASRPIAPTAPANRPAAAHHSPHLVPQAPRPVAAPAPQAPRAGSPSVAQPALRAAAQQVVTPAPVSSRVPVTATRTSEAAPASSRGSAASGGLTLTGSLSEPAASVAAPKSLAWSKEPQKPVNGPRRLAVFNHKGGTGKTTTTVSVAAGFARRGYRVLVVDTDSQGNVSASLNAKAEKSLYHVLVMGLRPTDAAIPVRENFDLIPSNETLAAAELYLAGRQNRDRVLRDRLAQVADGYDIILIDCSPSLSLMNQNALAFADGIIVPVGCDYLSLIGVRQVLKTVKNVNTLLHHPVQIHAVLPTFYDARARICRDAVDTMTKHFGKRCLTPIRMATKVKEAPAQGRTIFEYAPESTAAEDYARTVETLITGAHLGAGGDAQILARAAEG